MADELTWRGWGDAGVALGLPKPRAAPLDDGGGPRDWRVSLAGLCGLMAAGPGDGDGDRCGRRLCDLWSGERDLGVDVHDGRPALVYVRGFVNKMEREATRRQTSDLLCLLCLGWAIGWPGSGLAGLSAG